MWFLTVLLVLLLLLYSFIKLSYFQRKGVCVMLPSPLLGNLAKLSFGIESFVDFLSAGYEKFKDQRYYGLYQLHIPTLVLRDPELIKQVFVRDHVLLPDRGFYIDPECDLLPGLNLVNSTGQRWRNLRSALTPAFSSSKLNTMTPLMVERAEIVIGHLKRMVGNGKDVETDSVVSPYLNDAIASCAFGFAVDTLAEPENVLFRLGKTAVVTEVSQVVRVFFITSFPTLMKWLGVSLIKKSDTQKFKTLFESTLNSRRENPLLRRPDFIQALVDISQGRLKTSGNDESMDMMNNFTDDDLVSQAVVFYMAGYDTTANLINFLLHELACYPDIQERLVQDIERNYDGSNVYESVNRMEYLDMCVSETLRKWPLILFADRKVAYKYDFGPTSANTKDHFVGDPGVVCWIPIFCLHRDERFWNEPTRFDPERFSAERKSKILPYTYLPFGTGSRHCIGSRFALLTAKVFVVQYLRTFRVSLSPCMPWHVTLEKMAFVLRPTTPFSLYVELRT